MAKTKDYKLYDFAQAEVISKDAVRTISYLFEGFSRLAGTSISTYLRIPVELTLEGIEQIDYADLSSNMSMPGCISVVSIKPLNGLAVMELGLNFVFMVLDRLLGGQGQIAEKTREVSELEQAIVDKLIQKILEAITESWAGIVHFEFKHEMRESNPQMVQVFAPNERMLGMKFKIRIADTVSFMMLGIPSASFEPIRERLTTQGHQSATYAETEGERVEHERLFKNVQKAKIPVIACLGHTKMTLRQIMQLRLGDMIRVMRDPESRIEVVVKDALKFRGVIGRSQSKKAVKLVEAVDPRKKTV